MADSPANAALVLDLLVARGVIGAVTDHLGERPCFSLQKSTLRHLRAEPGFGGWHQDGAFLGDDVRTMNVWAALTPCGGDLPTPGLELVPRRFDEILSTDGGMVAHSVDPDLIAQLAGETPTVRPEFGVGDGLMFDEKLLHSTYLPAHMTDDRYALECWLFAPSHRSPRPSHRDNHAGSDVASSGSGRVRTPAGTGPPSAAGIPPSRSRCSPTRPSPRDGAVSGTSSGTPPTR